ncbi:nucleotidyltransferase domain-containing protein [Candidatus Woesearchaeota archaeon]|nr:nucleotidyltransferase domain-containing protein [Candidatus Woesearchaeota archaeon]
MILNEQKITMLESYRLNLDERITASQIAKKKKINQKSVYLFMEELEKIGIITSEMQGKNKLYFLNKSNKELVKQFLCSLEHLRTMYFYHELPEIKLIIQKILPHIQGIVAIFGSYAKGTKKETSDLDIFIAGTYDEKEIELIGSTFGVDINIKHQKIFKEDVLTNEVKKSHILIKNTEQFIIEANQWIN